MFSIFSQYLTPLGVSDVFYKPSDVYCQLRSTYNQGVKGIVENAKVFTLNNGEVDDEILYEIWSNKRLHDILIWVNKKIILVLDISDYRTIGVRMRIATGMINKLVYEGKLSQKLGTRIHNNFINIINGEFSAIATEDLPF